MPQQHAEVRNCGTLPTEPAEARLSAAKAGPRPGEGGNEHGPHKARKKTWLRQVTGGRRKCDRNDTRKSVPDNLCLGEKALLDDNLPKQSSFLYQA